MKKAKLAWINGKFVNWKNAKVHISTHAFHYGSSVFEGIRAYNVAKKSAIFRLDDHINRLFYSAKSFGLSPNFSKDKIKQVIKKLIKVSKFNDPYIRPLIYFTAGNISVYPKDVKANCAVLIYPVYKKPAKSLKVLISKFRKYKENMVVPGTKLAGNYVNSILAMQEARKKGFDEAIMLDYGGFASEGPTENLMIVKNNNLIIPKGESALHGITEDTIFKIAKDLKIKTIRKKVTVKELKNSDELFFSGTAREVSPIISIDGRKIGNGKPGPITEKIKDNYFYIVRAKNKKYLKMLTFID